VLSPDGRWLAFRSADGKTIRLWNVVGKEQVAIPNEISTVYGLSRDGETLAAFGRGPSAALQLWDRRRSTLLHEFPVVDPDAVMLSLDASTMAVIQADGTGTTISIWDGRSGKRQAVIHRDDREVVTTLSPDGTKVATVDGQGAVRLWNTQTGSLEASCLLPSGRRVGLRFFPDGKSILVGYSCEHLPFWRHAKISVRNTETLEEQVVLWRKDLRWRTVAMALAFAGWIAWVVVHHRRGRRGTIAQAEQSQEANP
jgi:WD40 repeat protein